MLRLDVKAFQIALLIAGAGWISTADGQTPLTFGDGSNGPLPSGSFLWLTQGNWTDDNRPDNNTERAIIGNATGDRLITTPGVLTLNSIEWTQSTDLPDGQANRISLAGDLTNTIGATFSNTSTNADPSRMVMDLNGHTADFHVINLAFGNVTFKSTGGGGTILIRSGVIGNVVLEDDITVRVKVTGSHGLSGDLHPNSTFEASVSGTHTMRIVSNTTGLGNLVVGRADGAATTDFVWDLAAVSGVNRQIQGDVTIHPNATFRFGTANSISNMHNLAVAGDWTDRNTTGGYDVNGRILFNGGSITAPSSIDIRRTGLTTEFRVGTVAGDGIPKVSPGHIRLAHDLTTTGAFSVRSGSSVDLNGSTLTTGNFFLNDGATLGYTIGPDPGVIHVTSLTLDDFTLSLTNLPNNGWQNGDDLILFTYESLNNLMSLSQPTILISDGWIRFDAFVAADNVVMLTNVYVPEPAGAAVLVSAAIGVLLGRSRRRLR